MPDDPDAERFRHGGDRRAGRERPVRRLPATRRDLRDQLPGIEPERRVTDWGRSERVEGVVDRTVYDFFYRYWFRVAVEGVENVPHDGAALLVANHSGALPSDGPMIAKAVKEEHPRPRPVHISLRAPVRRAGPGSGCCSRSWGRSRRTRRTCTACCSTSGSSCWCFPRGPAAPASRSRTAIACERSITSCVQAALRAAAPIVPVAVLGAEEALPVLARVSLLRRLTRLPRVARRAGIPAPGQVQDPFPGADPDRRSGAGAVARSRARPGARRRHPRADPGEPARDGRRAPERVARVARRR